MGFKINDPWLTIFIIINTLCIVHMYVDSWLTNRKARKKKKKITHETAWWTVFQIGPFICYGEQDAVREVDGKLEYNDRYPVFSQPKHTMEHKINTTHNVTKDYDIAILGKVHQHENGRLSVLLPHEKWPHGPLTFDLSDYGIKDGRDITYFNIKRKDVEFTSSMWALKGDHFKNSIVENLVEVAQINGNVYHKIETSPGRYQIKKIR